MRTFVNATINEYLWSRTLSRVRSRIDGMLEIHLWHDVLDVISEMGRGRPEVVMEDRVVELVNR